jgi:CAAX prenyl protease-like protein
VAEQSQLSPRGLLDHPAVPYVAPFVGFLALLAARPYLAVLGVGAEPVRFLLVALLIGWFSRSLLKGRPGSPLGSVLVGLAVFAIWVGPDVLMPGYRQGALFNNSIVGKVGSALAPQWRSDVLVLLFRAGIATLLVPVLEELFWRGWLMRWLIDQDFLKVPLGAFAAFSFWVSAVLFALEHGSYWDVGFAAGVAYNAWMVRTKNLWDCILAHAVTNGALCAYVVVRGQWQYWL